MKNNIIGKIFQLCDKYKITLLDIDKIKITALKQKEYDIVVYLNNNSSKYISFVKNRDNKR